MVYRLVYQVRGIMEEIVRSDVIVPQLTRGLLDPLQPSVNGSALVFDTAFLFSISQCFLASCSRIMPYLLSP